MQKKIWVLIIMITIIIALAILLFFLIRKGNFKNKELYHKEKFLRLKANHSKVKYPDKYKGKGIVICAGGIKYLTSAWVNINLLRHHNCELPIEVWYLKGEIIPSIKKPYEPGL